MARTLIEIASAAIDEIGHHEVPVTFIGSSNATARKSRAIMQTAGEIIARSHPWQVLQREHTFSLVASQEEYDPPADMRPDFARLHGTSWDRANEWPMYDLSPGHWQSLKSGILQAVVHSRGRVRGGKMLIWPTPGATDAGHILVYEYISKNWLLTEGTPADRWTTDADVPVIDDFLLHLEFKWRFLASSNLPHQSEHEDAAMQLELAKGRDAGAAPVINLSGRMHDIHYVGLDDVPETGYGSP